MKKQVLKVIGVLIINLLIISGCQTKEKEEGKNMVNNKSMLSYTIDGEKTDKKIT